ncbi:cupin domain-containing protein [Virgibacillus sp. MSJ-26]|uniref:cupin domain-containing protein n=1 Tax=Virgibacillus sp. MSJ-26 TaxID=2841522 RepID=UPI001C108C1C|nr:cupin domain-containing protein [Virgibacillus sp. MSJ-26]MBU5468039.1 cupin domain-containing protein [Virgibacillus sp. MSJ-26]
MSNQDHKNTEPLPQPKKGSLGGNIYGAHNVEVERQNPDMLTPPDTDSGTMPSLKWPYALSHTRNEHGGWSREVTTRELPESTTIAGVNMHLEPGGVRELHWHKEAEWALMIKGSARVTAIDPEGNMFVDDVEEGGVWNFPSGIPHSIKGLENGAEFLLVFDDGSFSENSTFTITDWFAHTPKEALAKNFGVSEDYFDNFPKGEKYIYQGDVPGPLIEDLPKEQNESVTPPYTSRFDKGKKVDVKGGSARILDSTNFKKSFTIAAALVEVEPGGIRELHWHPNAAEWQYYLEGQGRMSVFASAGKARTYDYQAGDVGYVPFAMGHYIENTGDTTLKFLEMFRSDHFAEISLSQWMSQTPPYLLKEHLPVDDEFINNHLHSETRPVLNWNKNKKAD